MAATATARRAGIRPRLKDGETRRFAPVDEADPQRVQLRAVIVLRGAWTWESPGPPPAAFEAAAAAFVADNLGLAIDFARGLSPGHVPEGDVVRAATVGMLTALRRFDLSLAGKFSTYAVWWMKHECGQLLYRDEAGAGVPVPGSLRDDKRELEVALQVLSQLLKRDPTDEEIQRALAAAPRRVSGKTGKPAGPNPARWDLARVALVRAAYVGHRHKKLDDRRAAAPLPEDPEALLDLRRAVAGLPAPLRAVLAAEYDLGSPRDADQAPDDPQTRQLLLDIAVDRLRESFAP